MSSLFLRLVPAMMLALSLAAQSTPPQREIKVCADPDNLPFSNQAEQGFENRIAQIIARSLQARVRFVWWAARTGFLRNSLNAGECDLVMGLPAGSERAATTRPYYRSSYVLVTRNRESHREAAPLDSPEAAPLRYGVHLVGKDYPPPALVLARHGLAAHITPYRMYGEQGSLAATRELFEAVQSKQLDAAIAWGPVAGYFVDQAGGTLALHPLHPDHFDDIPFSFPIAMAVRKTDTGLLHELNEAITNNCAQIEDILNRYHVPQPQEARPACAQ